MLEKKDIVVKTRAFLINLVTFLCRERTFPATEGDEVVCVGEKWALRKWAAEIKFFPCNVAIISGTAQINKFFETGKLLRKFQLFPNWGIFIKTKKLLSLYNIKKDLWNAFISLWNIGAPEGIRTPDRLLRRQLLYPTELLARPMFFI